MKTYVAQIEVIAGDIQKNYHTMVLHIEKAKELDCDLIVFPEMCLPGYFIGDTWEQQFFLKKCEEYHEKIASLSKGIAIIFGSVGIDWKNKNEDGRVRKYNAAFCAYKGKLVANKKTKFYFWAKALLPNYREFDDSRHFFDLRKLAFEKKKSINQLYEPFNLTIKNKKFSIGICICEDSWAEDYSFAPVEIFAKKFKHDFFVNLSASPFSQEKQKKRKLVFTNLSNKIKVPIIYVNCVGIQNSGKTIFSFDGKSCLFSPKKNPTYFDNFFKEDFFIYNHGEKLSPPKQSSHFSSVSLIHTALEYGTKKICEQWGIKKVVIGLSGGIDSALSTVIFSQVLGAQNVFCVNMPSKFNSELTQENAKILAHNLGCPYAQVSIQYFVDQRKKQIESIKFANTMEETIHVSKHCYENLQARERGSGILASLAAAMGTVFSCNVNKTELTVGYGTLYGDLAGFLCPLGDLWKHEVYELAHYYNNNIFYNETIPNELFDVKPSAELSESQDVTRGLGDPLNYDYHDGLFSLWVETWQKYTYQDCINAYNNNTLDDLLKLGTGTIKKLFPHETNFIEDLMRWWKLYEGFAAIKRVQAPPILAVSKRSFGSDYREYMK